MVHKALPSSRAFIVILLQVIAGSISDLVVSIVEDTLNLPPTPLRAGITAAIVLIILFISIYLESKGIGKNRLKSDTGEYSLNALEQKRQLLHELDQLIRIDPKERTKSNIQEWTTLQGSINVIKSHLKAQEIEFPFDGIDTQPPPKLRSENWKMFFLNAGAIGLIYALSIGIVVALTPISHRIYTTYVVAPTPVAPTSTPTNTPSPEPTQPSLPPVRPTSTSAQFPIPTFQVTTPTVEASPSTLLPSVTPTPSPVPTRTNTSTATNTLVPPTNTPPPSPTNTPQPPTSPGDNDNPPQPTDEFPTPIT